MIYKIHYFVWKFLSLETPDNNSSLVSMMNATLAPPSSLLEDPVLAALQSPGPISDHDDNEQMAAGEAAVGDASGQLAKGGKMWRSGAAMTAQFGDIRPIHIATTIVLLSAIFQVVKIF